ncbi:hypothetical protein [Mesorhizobium sp. 113-3-3]|uniref:hypothetical protein n=1 Tax=Mesorhizobium sp. 113-3-3 TaxID=2744516 RepID=UPI001928A837|nr:hypothetical protein [Mesorhizobium sp. 113-3-3]BCG79908.1 hypothetical protein MesoLj113b_34500 [Mesorhizobium sp. 113-3-3]
MKVGVAAVFVAGILGLSVQWVEAADKLPFPDGSYASKAKFCKMSREQAYAEFEFAFYDIRGKEISNYETYCTVKSVSVKGSAIEFKQVCETEGESKVDKVAWKKLSANSFSDEKGQIWTGCGRFVE